jgi:hypothetical protein
VPLDAGAEADVPTPALSSIEDWARALSPNALSPLVPLVPAASAKPYLERYAALSPVQRIEAFRKRGKLSLSISITNPNSYRTSLAWVLESFILLEPAVLEAKTRPEALCMLHPILSTAFHAERLAHGPGVSSEVVAIVEQHRAWLNAALAARAAYHAESLRTYRAGIGCVEDSVEFAQRELPSGRSNIIDLLRRLATVAESDLGRVSADESQAFASLFMRADDLRSAELWLGRAKAALGADASAAKRQAKLQERLTKTAKLLAAPATALHARADLLIELDRGSEARAVLEAAEPHRPHTLKTAARLALLSFQERLMSGGVHEALSAANDEMREIIDGPHDELVISVALGLEGARLQEAQGNGTFMAEVGRARPRLANLTAALATYNPGRASALELLLSMYTPCEQAILGGDPTCFLTALGTAMPRGIALKQKYPDEGDIDQVNALLIVFAQDRTKATEALLARPAQRSRDDRDFMLARAKAALAVASSLADPRPAPKLRALLDEVPSAGSGVGFRDLDKELLAADWLLFEASTASPRDAKAAYEKARDAYSRVFDAAGPEDRKRIVHNLAMIAQRLGRADEARGLMRGLVADGWQTQLAQAVGDADPKKQDAGLRGLKEEPSAFELLWKASVFEGKDRTAAEKALAELLRNPTQAIRREAVARGIGWGGVLKVGLGLNMSGHAVSSSAYAALWLMPMPKRSLAEVEKSGLRVK